MTDKNPRRTRNDPRREATRIAIIEKAEALFARNGIEGVSLRQIGSAIGSGNTSVVAYHFGTKESLVEAIFHHRLPAIDARRRTLLQEAIDQGEESELSALLRALWLPLFEQVDAEGHHSYAGFVGALMRAGDGRQRLLVHDDYPVTQQLLALLLQALPDDIQPLFSQRITLSAVIITGGLEYIDRQTQSAAISRPQGEAIFADILRAANAALLAPTRD